MKRTKGEENANIEGRVEGEGGGERRGNVPSLGIATARKTEIAMKASAVKK